MKIVHIIISERYIEGESYQENLLPQKHKDLGYDVSIITSQRVYRRNDGPYYLDEGEYFNKYGIKVIVLPTKRNTISYYFSDKCKGLYEKLCEERPDVIFCHQFSNFDIRHIIRYKHLHPDVRVFADNHNDYYNNPVVGFKGLLKRIYSFIFGRMMNPITIRFWGTLPWRCQYLHEIYKIPEKKIGLLVMGADEKRIIGRDENGIRNTIRKMLLLPENAFVVISGGTIDKRKQIDLLAEAISQIEDKEIYLIVFGKPTKDMEPIINQYKKIQTIRLCGWIPSDQIYDYYFASDLAFFPGTHSVLWEQAVACALPSVFCFWPMITHVNVNGNAILLTDVNLQSIKETILSLKFTSKYHEMKQKALLCAPQFYLHDIAIKAISE